MLFSADLLECAVNDQALRGACQGDFVRWLFPTTTSRPDWDLTTEVRLGARSRAHNGSEANADWRTSTLKGRVKQTVESALIRFGLHRTEWSKYV